MNDPVPPLFAKSLAGASDVQVVHSPSPDRRELSIIMTGFELHLEGGRQAVLSRTVSFAVGIESDAETARVKLDLRCQLRVDPGASAVLCLFAAGKAEIVDLCAPGDGVDLCAPGDGHVTQTLSRDVRPKAGLAIALTAILTRDADSPLANGFIAVDTLDLALALDA